ncbi:MAG: DDE-type integrase/transposase/recombinase, partial [Wolbachia endosymbiont of Pissodes strobi]|nr:DDE-type integrase/transposase/recombinase [Wolbachia endosymbiont of Pissodes strobi]
MHSTHMGAVKMKAFARSYFWWPHLDEAIEKIAQRCKSCAVFASSPSKPSLVLWDYPDKVWSRLHADFFFFFFFFFGPCCNRYFLVIEDATSKWLECFLVNNLSSQTVINCFRGLFSRFGIPKEVCTDNGTAFCSKDFQEFLEKYGITHTGAPYHPEANGLAESAVKIMKKSILKANNDGVKDINFILDTFLFQYRNTPHTTTGECPAKLLLGRSLRTKFDLLLPST